MRVAYVIRAPTRPTVVGTPPVLQYGALCWSGGIQYLVYSCRLGGGQVSLRDLFQLTPHRCPPTLRTVTKQ